MSDKPLDLAEFAKGHKRHHRCWADGLPDDVKAEIVANLDVSVVVVVKWLHELGYPEASTGKIDVWRRRQRDGLPG
jgi:hypothetical protein